MGFCCSGATICISREIQCLPYMGYYPNWKKYRWVPPKVPQASFFFLFNFCPKCSLSSWYSHMLSDVVDIGKAVQSPSRTCDFLWLHAETESLKGRLYLAALRWEF